MHASADRARKLHSDLIQIGTCQRHTMCSWPQQSDPPQSDTCQAHTMRSRPPWSDLSHARVTLAHPHAQSCTQQSRYASSRLSESREQALGLASTLGLYQFRFATAYCRLVVYLHSASIYASVTLSLYLGLRQRHLRATVHFFEPQCRRVSRC